MQVGNTAVKSINDASIDINNCLAGGVSFNEEKNRDPDPSTPFHLNLSPKRISHTGNHSTLSSHCSQVIKDIDPE